MRTTKSSISGREISYDETKYLDLQGNIVERNPIEHPYQYDPYVIYKDSDFDGTENSYYSDRVMHCYFEKQEINDALDQMGLKPYGPSWETMSWKNPDQVGRFLSILLKKHMRCTAIMEGCNYANGYPYWIAYMQEK